jgi:hypothetical protein
MTLRVSFRPLRPDLDDFLFAEVGSERDGVQLSVVSALTHLGLDPWDEAGRLSSLSKREAVEQLAGLITKLPGASRPLAEAREIAGGLVEQLPKHDSDRPPPAQVQLPLLRRWSIVLRPSQLLVFCLVAAAAALVSMILHGGFPLGFGFP